MKRVLGLLLFLGVVPAEAAMSVCADAFAKAKDFRLASLEGLRRRTERNGIDDGPEQRTLQALQGKEYELIENEKARRLRLESLRGQGHSPDEIYGDALIQKFDQVAKNILLEKAVLSDQLYKFQRLDFDNIEDQMRLARLAYAEQVRLSPEYQQLLSAQIAAERRARRVHQEARKAELDYLADRVNQVEDLSKLKRQARALVAEATQLGARRRAMENPNLDPATWLSNQAPLLGPRESFAPVVIRELDALMSLRQRASVSSVLDRPYRQAEVERAEVFDELYSLSDLRIKHEMELRGQNLSSDELRQNAQSKKFVKQIQVLEDRLQGMDDRLIQLRERGLDNALEDAELAGLRYKKAVRMTSISQRLQRLENDLMDRKHAVDREAQALAQARDARDDIDSLQQEQLLELYRASRLLSGEITEVRVQRLAIEDPKLDPSSWFVE